MANVFDLNTVNTTGTYSCDFNTTNYPLGYSGTNGILSHTQVDDNTVLAVQSLTIDTNPRTVLVRIKKRGSVVWESWTENAPWSTLVHNKMVGRFDDNVHSVPNITGLVDALFNKLSRAGDEMTGVITNTTSTGLAHSVPSSIQDACAGEKVAISSGFNEAAGVNEWNAIFAAKSRGGVFINRVFDDSLDIAYRTNGNINANFLGDTDSNYVVLYDKNNKSIFHELYADTPAPTINDTRVATTQYVQNAITELINGAPGTLDTLNEIATSLANDKDFAGTMTTQLALKAPLFSPDLGGVPTAPTASTPTNGAQIATTKFVKDVLTDSPALNGVPTATTALAATSTTQIATTDFVHSAIIEDVPYENTPENIQMDGTAWVGTIKSVARGNHRHPIDTSRAPTANPTFTGTVRFSTYDVHSTYDYTTHGEADRSLVTTVGYVIDKLTTKSININTPLPLMDGTAANGNSLIWANQDHVHPIDISRAPLNNPDFTGTVKIGGKELATTGIANTVLRGTGVNSVATFGTIDNNYIAANAGIAISKLASQATKTILANDTGNDAVPTAVDYSTLLSSMITNRSVITVRSDLGLGTAAVVDSVTQIVDLASASGGNSVTATSIGVSGILPIANGGVGANATNTAARNVFIGPKSSIGAASFRALEATDLPQLAANNMPAYSGDVTSSAGGTVNTLASVATAAANIGPSTNTNLTFGGTFTVPQLTINAKGLTTSLVGRTMTMPTIATASSTADGLMTKEQFDKLNGIAAGANNYTYTHPTTVTAQSSSALYKITFNNNGHITNAVAVTDNDILDLLTNNQSYNYRSTLLATYISNVIQQNLRINGGFGNTELSWDSQTF
jgi:hypothetical protein